MEIRYAPRALDDLSELPERIEGQIMRKIDRLAAGLVGDIKALENAAYAYRLRSGDYRVLFDFEAEVILIQRVKHRKEAYE